MFNADRWTTDHRLRHKLTWSKAPSELTMIRHGLATSDYSLTVFYFRKKEGIVFVYHTEQKL